MKKVLSGILLAIFVLVLVLFIAMKTGLVATIKTSFALEDFTAADEAVGKNGKVTESLVINRKTGTEPFDNNDTAGNDSSEDNNIVRSFDQISWTVENTFGLKNPNSTESYSGGVLQIKASVPSSLASYVKWDLDSMAWIEGATLSTDGTTVTGYYRLSNTDVTVPGKQNTNYVLKVLGAPNNLEIKPTFEASLYGNNDSDKYTLNVDTVKVSATPRINVQLGKTSVLNYKSYFDPQAHDEVEQMTSTAINGRIQGYGITLQLYNQKVEQGLKGIEIPKGPITFDLTFTESIGTTDVTNQENYMPVMWDYKENTFTATTGKNGNNIFFNNMEYSKYAYLVAPYSKGTGIGAVHDSGTWTIVQDNANKNVYHVTVNNYAFSPDYRFPTINAGNNATTTVYYANQGSFSSGYIEAILQFPTVIENTSSIYMKAEVSNLKATSLSNQVTTEDQKSSDNMSNANITLYPPGSYQKHQYFHDIASPTNHMNYGSNYNLSPTKNGGEAAVAIGNEFYMLSRLSIGSSNDRPVASLNILQKFDDKAFEIPSGSNSSSAIPGYASTTEGDFKTLYAAKKDKSGWTDITQMQNTHEEDLVFFENVDALKAAGYTPVGILYEMRNTVGSPSGYYYFKIKMRIKNTADIGSTYAVINDARIWESTGHNFSWENGNASNYPQNFIAHYSGVGSYKNYVKTEYDENGEIITGTHNGGYASGNSVLVLGATLSVDKEIMEKLPDNTEKTNFDIGKNEYDVTFKLKPQMVNNSNTSSITGVNLKVTETLPKGLTYIPGSADIGEPTITENDDGSQTLEWTIYNQTVNEEVTQITYQAHIDEESANGKQYDTETVVEEIIASGETTKIGNQIEQYRTTTKAIQVINLTSYGLYKITDTPIIEASETGKYTVVASNKTDEDVTTFKLLDILPYNGDNRNTRYSGSYKISKITIKQINTATKEEIPINNLNLFVTENTNVRSKKVKDSDITSVVNTATTSGAAINKPLSAFLLTGTLKAQSKIEIEIEMTTVGSKAEDAYINSASAMTNPTAEAMQSANVKIEVVKRSISGYVWEDENNDGLMENERNLQNITVKLLDSNNTVVKTTTTDANGYYIFDNLEKKDYKVKFDAGNKYTITKKEIGSNIEINSKANLDGVTDVITKLNSLDSPLITEEFVNAGLVLKDARLVVKYLEEGTNKVLAEGYSEDKKYGDSYTTINGDGKVSQNYNEVRIEGLPSGIIDKDLTEVIYYYAKKDPNIDDKIEKDGTPKINKKDDTVTYNIKYNVSISEYIGKASVTVTDTLPYEIDETKSVLNGGIYDRSTKTITWTLEQQDVDTYQNQNNQISFEKDFKVIYKDLNPKQKVITNIVKGKVELDNKESEVETTFNTQILIPGTLIVRYKDDNGKELTKEEITVGLVGEKKSSKEKEINGYTLKTKPTNETVELIDGVIELEYIYTKDQVPKTGLSDSVNNIALFAGIIISTLGLFTYINTAYKHKEYN